MNSLNLFVVLALLAILSSFQNRALAQSSPIDTTLAAQYFQEAQVLCNRDNGKLWGISLCAPVLFVDRKTRTVVANQADKEGFLTKERKCFRRTTARKGEHCKHSDRMGWREVDDDYISIARR